MIKDLEAEETRRLREMLNKQGVKEAGDVRRMIDARIKEVTKRIKELDEQSGKFLQLSLFDEERLQIADDLRFLKARLEALQKERESKPDEVKRKYKLRTLRVFPLALEYLLPESLIREVR